MEPTTPVARVITDLASSRLDGPIRVEFEEMQGWRHPTETRILLGRCLGGEDFNSEGAHSTDLAHVILAT